ncbi:universal stress protein [Streptomyces sp. NPDC057909]|uniref:universal stress protein n=1 Tax=Streptomyces sp. NPDC057909 TaxID=3346277 RepID=UPI0036E43788
MGDIEGRRIVAGVSGSLGSLVALHWAASEARRHGAELLTVLAWEPPGGELTHRSSVFPPQMDGFRREASERLYTALRTAFGDAGPGVAFQGLVARGTPGYALVATADRADDLLVIGAGCRGRVHRTLFPSVARYCVAHAACPVLAVPPSPLQSELTSVHRRISWRLPFDTRELTDGQP